VRTCMSAQLQEVLLGHLQATNAHRWPGTDGMTVQDVLLSYPHAIASGQAPDRQELLRRHPDLADEVEAYFSLDLKSLDALVAHLDREVGTFMTNEQCRAEALGFMLRQVGLPVMQSCPAELCPCPQRAEAVVGVVLGTPPGHDERVYTHAYTLAGIERPGDSPDDPPGIDREAVGVEQRLDISVHAALAAQAVDEAVAVPGAGHAEPTRADRMSRLEQTLVMRQQQ